jgi:hypothetical protein
MRTRTLLIQVAAATVIAALAGCTTPQLRTGTDLVGAGGGAALASSLSHGNPAITAAGAAGGALLADVAGSQYQKQQAAAERSGYVKGQSDSIKELYWAQQAQQKRQEQEENGRVSYYDIPVPERTVNGAVIAPTTKTLRIEE